MKTDHEFATNVAAAYVLADRIDDAKNLSRVLVPFYSIYFYLSIHTDIYLVCVCVCVCVCVVTSL